MEAAQETPKLPAHWLFIALGGSVSVVFAAGMWI